MDPTSPERRPSGDNPTLVRALKLVLVTLLVGIAYLAAVTPPKETSNQRMVPTFELNRLDGGRLEDSDLVDQITVMNFFATWCGPCQAEMPELVRFAQEHAGRDIEVVGVSAGYDEAAQLKPFVRSFRVPYPVAVAGEGLLEELGFSTLPTTVIIDPRGRIAEIFEGAVNQEMLERSIERIQAGAGG